MKLIVITGVSRGLGFETAKKLLDKGYIVAGCSREKNESISTLEKKCENFKWFQCDVSCQKAVGLLFDNIEKWHEYALWGIINNAGIARSGLLPTFPNVEIDTIIKTNLLGAMYIARGALRQILKQKKRGGRIINISSIIASRGYNGLSAYSASKAGLDGMTRSLSRETGKLGVTVNSIAPGYLETEMSSDLSRKQRFQIINRTPLNRLGLVSDITPMILFLLSDEASFITGQTMVIDGGISV
jgi:3-oxoacyl-[acyl-carrier protein] reductase